jgi:hypothetical protein
MPRRKNGSRENRTKRMNNKERRSRKTSLLSACQSLERN